MVLFFTIAGYTEAQNPDVITFVSDDGVYLRWKGRHTAGLDGYNLYRQQEGSTNWVLINDTPLRLITDNRLITDRAGYQAGMFLQLFGIDDINGNISVAAYQDLIADPQAVSFMEVMCLVNPELGYLLGEIYVDSSIVPGRSYKYRVDALVNRTPEIIGQTALLNTADIQTIPSVSDPEGEGLDGMNRILWPRRRDLLSSGEIVTYRVYRSDSLLGPYRRVNFYGILPVQVTSGDYISDDNSEEYLDKYLINGDTYYYYIKSVNAFGLESEPGITIQLTAGADLVPDPPINIRAALLGRNLKLEWDNTNDGIEGYEVYRSLSKRKDYNKVYPSSTLLLNSNNYWIDIDIEEGGTYYYYIVGVNKNLRSNTSDTLAFYFMDLRPPGPPLIVMAVADSAGITIYWQKSQEPDIRGYEIERSADENFTSRMLLNTYPVADTFYIDRVSPESQTTYGYVVYAVDTLDNRSGPSIMVMARMPDIVPPQEPIITGLNRNGNQVTLSWTNAVEEDFEIFRIYQSIDQEDLTLAGETVQGNYVIELETSGRYGFAVSTVDQSGNESPLSEVLTFTYDADEFPPPPENFNARVNRDDHIRLTWRTPRYNDIYGYYLIRTDMESDKVLDIGQLSAGQTEYIDKYVSKGKTYRYMIKTYNSKWMFSTPVYREIEIE